MYEDVDRNGVRNNGENGIAGWTVFWDANLDGTLNDGEPSAVTNQDGDYSLRGLAAGNLRIAEIVQPGWEATSPISRDIVAADGRSTQVDFFNFSGGNIAGTIWNDVDQNGTRAIDPAAGSFLEPGLSGWTVFLDLDTNDVLDDGEPSTITAEDGTYEFTNLPPEDYEVTEILPIGWQETKGVDIKQTVSVVSRTTQYQDFANFSTTNGSIEGTVFNDLNADGIRETTESGLEGWTVFIDHDRDGVLSAGEPELLTGIDGSYNFTNVATGTVSVGVLPTTGWRPTSPASNSQTFVLRSGQELSAINFGEVQLQDSSIHGRVYADRNRNGTLDPDEHRRFQAQRHQGLRRRLR